MHSFPKIFSSLGAARISTLLLLFLSCGNLVNGQDFLQWTRRLPNEGDGDLWPRIRTDAAFARTSVNGEDVIVMFGGLSRQIYPDGSVVNTPQGPVTVSGDTAISSLLSDISIYRIELNEWVRERLSGNVSIVLTEYPPRSTRLLM